MCVECGQALLRCKGQSAWQWYLIPIAIAIVASLNGSKVGGAETLCKPRVLGGEIARRYSYS